MFIRTQNGKILSSVKDYALYCTFVRAVDHFKPFTLGTDGLVVLVTPEGRPVADYKRSASAYLFDDISSEEAVHVGYACISGRDKPERTKVEYEERCGNKRRAIVVSDTKNLPAFIAVAADIIIDVEPITKADLQEACQVVLDLEMTGTQARQLLRFPLDLVFSALRQYRTVATSIRHLTTHAADYGRGEPIAEPHPRLEQLHGYGPAKTWGLQIAADLKLWSRGKLKWSEVDRGLLLSGPPGVGKTIFARALAETCGIHFVATSVAQWQSKGHLGDTLQAMRGDFARALDNVPAIIFLDELDSIGDRSRFPDDHASYSIQVVNGLLELLDGTSRRDGLIVLGATNQPARIDPAIRRPGRLDRHIVIGMPDEVERIAILSQQLGDDCSFGLEALGPLTEAMSGADLAQLVRDARKSARRESRSLTMDDLTSQLPQLIQVTGEYRRAVAFHEAGHALVGIKLNFGRFVGVYVPKQLNPRLEIQQAGGAGFESPMLMLKNEQRYRDEICLRLAGIAAEKLMTGSHGEGAGVGPQSDLAMATSLALKMETKGGMGERLFQFGDDTAWKPFGPQPVEWLMDRVNGILHEELARARSILTQEQPLLVAVSEQLERVGTVSPDELEKLRKQLAAKKRSPANHDPATSPTIKKVRLPRNRTIKDATP